jgi:hypothetical protein
LNTICSSDKKHGLQLSFRADIAMDVPHPGDTIQAVRHQLARRISGSIMENPKFFQSASHDGGRRVSIEVCAVVMTVEEYRQLMVEQFKLGTQHALGYRSGFDFSRPSGEKL